ncbi:hypothetical protein ABMA27_013716 [Loxostege sticticalis]|uniref:Uncharacterized protein n=1 Tax=Loxostege sticticalis TaxID=481309 RepID=A0ABR3IB95_LOXSC
MYLSTYGRRLYCYLSGTSSNYDVNFFLCDHNHWLACDFWDTLYIIIKLYFCFVLRSNNVHNLRIFLFLGQLNPLHHANDLSSYQPSEINGTWPIRELIISSHARRSRTPAFTQRAFHRHCAKSNQISLFAKQAIVTIRVRFNYVLPAERPPTCIAWYEVNITTLPTILLFKLERNQNASIVRGNIAMLAVESTPSLHLRGTRVAAAHDVFADDSLQLITGENEDALQMTDKNDAVVFLPESVTRVERRISLVAFRTSTPFVSDHNCQDCQLNSKVVSINVENLTSLEDGEMIRIYLSPSKRVHHRNQTRVCAYWHFHENGTGFWSQEGCTITKTSQKGMLDLCECNHLTHFAEILIHKDVFSESDENTLEIISIIGCCFSLFGISVIVLTAALFKSWRQNNSNKIWLNLGSAVFILDVCFLLTVFVDFDDHITGCVVVGVALHYSVLATFCWMLVVSILSFRKLVLVFTSELPCKLLITVLFAWGLPFLVIGILFAVDSNAYSGRFEDTTPSGKFCYPKGIAFWVSVFGPMAVMWLVNWILYALILRSMFAGKTNIRKHTSSKDTLRCASISCLLAFLCGIPWVFGFFAYNIVAAYLFSITVTFQGFVLFLFFILGNKKTRGLWTSMFRKRFRREEEERRITTSTDRSKGPNTTRSFFPISSPLAPDEASGSLLSETRL